MKLTVKSVIVILIIVSVVVGGGYYVFQNILAKSEIKGMKSDTDCKLGVFAFKKNEKGNEKCVKGVLGKKGECEWKVVINPETKDGCKK